MDRTAETSASISSRDARALRRAEGPADPQDDPDGPGDLDQEQGELEETVTGPPQQETVQIVPGPVATIELKQEETKTSGKTTQLTNPTKLPQRTTLQKEDDHVTGQAQSSGVVPDQVSSS